MLPAMGIVVVAAVGWLVLSVVLAALVAALFHGGFLGEGTDPR